MQPPYKSLAMLNSYLYMTAHIWNRLPDVTKSSTTRARLNNVKFTYNVPVHELYIILSIFTFLHTARLEYK